MTWPASRARRWRLATPNLGSVRVFDVIDAIKSVVDKRSATVPGVGLVHALFSLLPAHLVTSSKSVSMELLD
ncbi:hypothetical protein C2845_PM17G07090 [Panicum miliaceum]|uniref:Uncharacterized protein n=1 Tax=Panicum miliaceum TaxID=4540 RepID=A0A3L6Q2L7_PANMI|nr:hypothetical protein C2845_PM17G07090 [Panicum miliaceum]